MGTKLGYFGVLRMALDKRYLEKHGQKWRVQVKVPLELRPVIGKSKLTAALNTTSLAEANLKRWPFVNEFHALIAEAREGKIKQKGSVGDPLVKDSLKWRKLIEQAQDDPEVFAEYDQDGDLVADSSQVVAGYLSDEAQRISDEEGRENASLFLDISKGTATPIMLMVDTWLAEKAIKPRQKIDYKRAVTKLDVFLTRKRGKAAPRSAIVAARNTLS